MGHLVAHPLQSEQLGSSNLLRQRNRVAVGVHGILGAVYDERRDANLPEPLPPTIPRVDCGMVGNARRGWSCDRRRVLRSHVWTPPRRVESLRTDARLRL